MGQQSGANIEGRHATGKFLLAVLTYHEGQAPGQKNRGRQRKAQGGAARDCMQGTASVRNNVFNSP